MAIYLPRTKVGTQTSLFGKQVVWAQAVPNLLRGVGIGHILKSGKYLSVLAVGEDKKKSNWLWPLGLLATGLAGAGMVLFRGCWHSKMSWPVRAQGHSYQVCLGCGIKRLFDEEAFRAYGPYSYDLNGLIALADARRETVRREMEPSEHRSAS